MTDNELKLFEKAATYGTIDFEISRCIDMINSILAYGFNTDAKYVLEREKNSHHNYLEDYIKELGEDKVLELIQGQIDSIDHVVECAYYSEDGGFYNEIIWKE